MIPHTTIIFMVVSLAACLVLAPEIAGDDTMASSAENVPLSNSKAETYAPGSGRAAQEPIHLKPGPHLFIDDFLVASSENVERVVNVPRRDSSIPNPIVTGKEDGCFQPYMTILRDAQSGRFRLWYGHRTEDSNAGQSHVASMESDDGIHWIRPPRVLKDPAPIQFGVSIIDEGADFPNAAQRYKYGWWQGGGLRIAASPDGLAWTPMTPDVVLPHNHDITSIFFDPLRNHYVATISVYRTGDKWSGQRRITMQSCSNDLLKWPTPHYVITPEDGPDPGETQFYAMEGYLVRGDLWIGMVKVLRDDLKADTPPDPPDAYGMGYTALAWSRDGETWVRDRAHFFDPDPRQGAWDHAHAWIDEQVVVDDDVYLYYGGYARGHKVNRFEERQIGLVAMKRDRYVARESKEKTGTITTPLLILEGDTLTLNADAKGGEIRVQLLDEAGKAIPGFASVDCAPIRDDAVAIPVSWTRPLRELDGKPIRIQFALARASVFAMELM
jgi:hypothetical protein